MKILNTILLTCVVGDALAYVVDTSLWNRLAEGDILGDINLSRGKDGRKNRSRPRPRQDATRCGIGFGTVCRKDQCCSSEGWCGTGYLYCSGPACQYEYGPSCDANVRPSGPDTGAVSRDKIGYVPYGKGIFHCTVPGTIALTYDDGPNRYTEDLLDLLQKYKARATFFVSGRNQGKGAINDPETPWPGLIRRMIADGHQVASHTWSHQRLIAITKASFDNQLLHNEAALADLLGYFPTYMRPPYSASNATVDGWLADLGYHVTYFDLDTQGYLHATAATVQASKEIWDRAVEGADPTKRTFLQIEHDTVFQAYNITEHMLESLARNGFTATTVGECLGDPKENWYRSAGSQPPAASGSGSGSATSSSQRATGSFPPTVDGRCGFGQGDQTCRYEPQDRCCSAKGWCGATVDHCGLGCQPVFGDCDGVAPPGVVSSSSVTGAQAQAQGPATGISGTAC